MAWQQNVTGWGRLRRRILVALLVLALAGVLAPATSLAVPQDYEYLRLLAEALHEISTKYVWQKSESGMLEGALRGMVNSLDPDSSYLSPQEYKEFQAGQKGPRAEAGLELVVKDNLLTVVSVLDGGPADRAGLKPGDHILKIDGKLMRNLTTQEGVRRFQGNAGTTLKLQVLRNNLVKPLDLTVILEPMGPGKVSSQIIQDHYEYIRVPFFTDNTPRELADALKQARRRQPPVKGVILDLRNNARGTLEQAVRTGGVLLGEKEIVASKGRTGDEELFVGKGREQAVRQPFPTVILVDQGTARAAEIVAAALHDHSAGWLLGTKTFGLCGLTKVFPLEDGAALVMTVAQCYTPKGAKITGKGLDPDVAAKTPEGPEAAAAQPPKTLPPDQDPWVFQAVEILKAGKPTQVAQSND